MPFYNTKDIPLHRKSIGNTFEEYVLSVQTNSVVVTDSQNNLVVIDSSSFYSTFPAPTQDSTISASFANTASLSDSASFANTASLADNVVIDYPIDGTILYVSQSRLASNYNFYYDYDLESFSFGDWNTYASGKYSFGHGINCNSVGTGSHAEGVYNFAVGDYSHAEGYFNNVWGIGSHVEGQFNLVYGNFSHGEGHNNTASAPFTHVEGYNNFVSSSYSYVGGANSIVSTANELDLYKGRYTITNGFSLNNKERLSILIGNNITASGYNNVIIGNNLKIYSPIDGILAQANIREPIDLQYFASGSNFHNSYYAVLNETQSLNPRFWGRNKIDMTFLGGYMSGSAPIPYNNDYQCSAMSLLTPKHVLTARHCRAVADEYDYPLYTIIQEGYSIVRFVTNDNELIERRVLTMSGIPNSDLMIGVLDSDVPASIKPAKLLPSASLIPANVLSKITSSYFPYLSSNKYHRQVYVVGGWFNSGEIQNIANDEFELQYRYNTYLNVIESNGGTGFVKGGDSSNPTWFYTNDLTQPIIISVKSGTVQGFHTQINQIIEFFSPGQGYLAQTASLSASDFTNYITTHITSSAISESHSTIITGNKIQILNNTFVSGAITASSGFIGTASFANTSSYALNANSSLTTGSTYPITSSWSIDSTNSKTASKVDHILQTTEGGTGATYIPGGYIPVGNGADPVSFPANFTFVDGKLNAPQFNAMGITASLITSSLHGANYIQLPFSSSTTSLVPTVQTGSMYFNATDNLLYIYNGTVWRSGSFA